MNDGMDAMEAKFEGLRGEWGDFKKALLEEVSRRIGEEIGRALGKRPVDESNEESGGGPSSGIGSNESQRSVEVTDKLDEFRMSVKKVELPSFDGNDPVAWIDRAETYFEVQKTSDDMQIKLVKLSMEAGTIHWFNIWRDSTDYPTWEKLKNALLVRFGIGRLDNPFEELRDVKQIGTVDDYMAEFEVFSSQCGRMPDVQFLGYFVGGLKPEIRSCLHTLKPHNRYQALQMARDVEVKLVTLFNPEEGNELGRVGLMPV